MPEELASASRDTYIQRRNITFVEAADGVDGIDGISAHYECESRFIGKSEYEMLQSIESISTDKAIDEYTLQLMEDGVL